MFADWFVCHWNPFRRVQLLIICLDNDLALIRCQAVIYAIDDLADWRM